MKTISQAAKTDLLLTLAVAFERNFAESKNREKTRSARELVENFFGALDGEDLELLKSRAEFLDDLADDARENWRESKLEKIRGRGRAKRLDENLNPSQIVGILSREPLGVQMLILQNLPGDLSRRIALYMDLNYTPGGNSNGGKVNSEILELVRQKFLANFIALENLDEPDALDRFSVDELDNFIRHLGLREIAIACRGIGSKETLAAFLNRFDEQDAREIALYITELDKIRPFWVAQADALVRKSWNADLAPAKVIKKIGFKLLAAAFVLRDENKVGYAAQKLSIREVKNWQRLVNVSRKKYFSSAGEDRRRLDKRRSIIERLAVKFAEAGKL